MTEGVLQTFLNRTKGDVLLKNGHRGNPVLPFPLSAPHGKYIMCDRGSRTLHPLDPKPLKYVGNCLLAMFMDLRLELVPYTYC